MIEFLKALFQGFRCYLFHRRQHFNVGAGFQLCAICDAPLLDYLIKTEEK